jgi:hypothetical protein
MTAGPLEPWLSVARATVWMAAGCLEVFADAHRDRE